MNINKQAVSILLFLLFCFSFSEALLAQSTNELKKMIRVDVQSFMTESKINHGYYVVHCKIQSLDTKNSHKITLSCDRVATKSFDLPAGDTINASLPLPVTNSNFGNAIKVLVDNREIDSFYCPMRFQHYSTSYHSHGYYYYEDPDDYSTLLNNNTFMSCRSLRKQLSEADCIFAENDCQYWPQDRLDYSCVDYILLTPSELSAAPAGVQAALRQFVYSGGILWLFDCENQKKELDKIEWITQLKNDTKMNQKALDNESQSFECPLAFGRVFFFSFTPDEFHKLSVPQNSNSDKTILHDIWEYSGNLPSREVSWFKPMILSDWQKEFPIVDDLSIPRTGITIVIFLFVLLAGPVNLFLLTKHNKRIWLLITVPVLSFLFAGAILLYVTLSEGFKTETRICALDYLDQRDGSYASMMQMGVYARTSPSNIVYDAEDELNIIEDDVNSDRLNVDWTSGKQVIHSNFAPVRNPAYYKIRKTGTSRLNLDFDFNAASPYVVNGLGKDVDLLYVRDADGKLWKAEDIGAGKKATLTLTNSRDDTNYKTVSDFQSLISELNWNDVATSLNKSSVSIPPNCYMARFHSPGPFSNKGISYANEKRTFGFLLGRF